MKPTWEPPKTSKVYLHTPTSDRILMLHPDAKITNLSLRFDHRHTGQDACGVHLIAGDEPCAIDFRQTKFETPQNGYPFYSVSGTDPDNGCSITMSAFASDAEESLIYVRVHVSNPYHIATKGTIGLLPREVKNNDQYLTGLWDTGFESYLPNFNQWLLQRDILFSESAPFTASGEKAMLRILSADGFSVRWISRKEQPHRFRAHDYFRCDYLLQAGASQTLDFVFCAKPFGLVSGFQTAKAAMCAYWERFQERVERLPLNAPPRILDMFRQNITQCLQMIARYENTDGLFVRQGDVGRYLWVWEAIHVLLCLDTVGIHDYSIQILDTLCKRIKSEGSERGRFCYSDTEWDNAEGALLLGISEHIRLTDSAADFERYEPYMIDLLTYIDKMRHTEKGGKYPGLYPSATSHDKTLRGHHWIFTDAVVLRGIRSCLKVFEKYHSRYAGTIRSLEAEYKGCLQILMNDLYKGHEDDEAFILPHIAEMDFDSTFHHSYYIMGAPFLSLLGMMKPDSRLFEQMEAFFNRNGLFENNLAGRITNANDTGLGAYGDCYYIGLAEICWIYPWMRRGEWDKADAMTDAMLRFGVTDSFAVSERYCSFDPWYVPWQPNGSGSARLCLFLLDYYQEKSKCK